MIYRFNLRKLTIIKSNCISIYRKVKKLLQIWKLQGIESESSLYDCRFECIVFLEFDVIEVFDSIGPLR